MPKFFIKSNQIQENKVTILGEDVKHITQVLRVKPQEKLIVCNEENGLNYLVKIENITPSFVMCQIIDCMKPFVEPPVDVTIFQGLPKADKMEYIIQKNVELGAKEIIPVTMSRCMVKLEEKSAIKKIERWQKIAESAAKQSGRDYIPKIQLPINVQELSKRVNEFDLILLAYENEKESTLKQELKKMKLSQGLKIGVVIGPEGGLDLKEVKILVEQGARKITIGKRILRTETASIMVMSNIIYEYEM